MLCSSPRSHGAETRFARPEGVDLRFEHVIIAPYSPGVWFDARSYNDRSVFDVDADNRVIGFIATGRQNIGIHISLFDGRYKATVSTYDECCGFVEGVESVLNHLLGGESTPGRKPQYNKSADGLLVT